MPRERALSATHLGWERELCKKGCKEWIPWYKTKRGETVRGCRIGKIPEKRDERWYCHPRKPGG